MHELATTQSLVKLCVEAAERDGFQKVKEIRLHIGAFSGIEPGYLREFFPYVSKDTVCEDAELVCEIVPGTLRCYDCGYEGTAEKIYECPRCGGAIKLVSGREFFVDSLAVE